MANAVKINETLVGKHRNPDRRNSKMGDIFTAITKFAVDSAVSDSIKGVAGLKRLYKIVQERLVDASAPLPLNSPTKPECLELAKKMEMNMEEMQEEISELEPLNTTSAKPNTVAPEKTKPNAGGSDSSSDCNNGKKRIFIRSRL